MAAKINITSRYVPVASNKKIAGLVISYRLLGLAGALIALEALAAEAAEAALAGRWQRRGRPSLAFSPFCFRYSLPSASARRHPSSVISAFLTLMISSSI